MPKICAATSDLDTYRKPICRKKILYLDQPFVGNSHFSDKVRPKVREEKGEDDSMTARCVVRLQQMRIAGACPSPPGHTRDSMALCGARNVHAHPV